jgi:hypothetical protein
MAMTRPVPRPSPKPFEYPGVVPSFKPRSLEAAERAEAEQAEASAPTLTVPGIR